MNESLKQSPLAIGVLTGVTALIGGIEPAAAAIIPLSQSFGVSASDNQTRFTFAGSGDFAGSGSDPTTFSQFDSMGGTRQLTGVTVTVTSLASLVQALVDGQCFAEVTAECGGSATNSSTFSALIGLGGPLLPATQVLTATASDNCTLGSDGRCEYLDTTDTSTLPAAFSFTATAGQLSQFVGGGTFNVTPSLSLAGEFSWNNLTTFQTVANLQASTTWSGTIDVTYEYGLVNGVPEPASLFLVGVSLAGMGLARRKSKPI